MNPARGARPGWLVVVGGLAVNSIFGLFFSFGVFYAPLLHEFGWTKAQTGSIVSVASLFESIGGIAMGLLADRYGPRVPLILSAALAGLGIGIASLATSLWQWYLLYGVMGGLGWGAAATIPVTIAVKRFGWNRSIALGMVTTGSAFGSTIIPTTSAYLIAAYGWKQALVLLAAVYAAIFLFAGLVANDPFRSKEQKKAETSIERQVVAAPNSPGGSRARVTALVLLSGMFLMPNFGLIIVYTYLPPLSLARAIPPILAASVVSALSAISILGRMGSFFLVRWRGATRTLPLAIALMSGSVLALSLGFNLSSLYILAMAFGLGYGLWIALMPAATAELFGRANYGKFWGFLNAWGGIGGLIGPIAAGELLDLGASDLLVLLMAGLVTGVAFLFALALYRLSPGTRRGTALQSSP